MGIVFLTYKAGFIMPITLKCEYCKEVFTTRRRSDRIIRFCSMDCSCRATDQQKRDYWKQVHVQLDALSEEEKNKKMKESFEKWFTKNNEGCWEWQGAKKSLKKLPYGSFTWKFGSKRFTQVAHRISYRIYKGEIPSNKIVMHICDNPPCVNPDHLKIGTYLENQRDKLKKGRCKVEKLTIKSVKEIKKCLSLGVTKQRLANDFNVSRQTIYSIEKGKTWSDITIED